MPKSACTPASPNGDFEHGESNAATCYQPLVGIKEAAKYLNMSAVHVRKMARTKQLPAINFNGGGDRGTWRFSMSALAEYCHKRLSGDR